MFRKKLLAMGLIITIALCGLSGCTGNTTTAPQETTTPEVTTGQEEISTEEEETTTEYDNTSDVYGRVDAEDICKHLVIDGKQVDFPWTLNALGDEYDFGNLSVMDNGVSYATGLYRNGEKKFTVMVWDEDEVDRDSLIYYIIFNVNDSISLYDFKKGDTIADVVKKLGVPDEIDAEELTTLYRYMTKDIYVNVSYFSENEKLHTISIEIPNEVMEGAAQ